jgi:hypothetical protein
LFERSGGGVNLKALKKLFIAHIVETFFILDHILEENHFNSAKIINRSTP